GKEVLTMIKEGKNIDQITDLMIEKYEVDKITLERYLSDFVNDLSVNNLLEE
ncbi:MAG: HPr-rel-A system PqqD family protein, partial [Odoribacter sp.]|nr:HPr-rel-A system PqqD family protein [Odoribacter sp.]